MATTNPVYQVLVTKGNQAILASGNTIADLEPGQIGVFDFHTGLSVDASTAANAHDVFIAVGIDRDGDTNMDDVLTSAGQMIQKSHFKNYNIRQPENGVPMIVELTGFKAKCETEYGIKVEVRNQLGYLLNGYNQVAKTFLIKTGCCNQEYCTSCPEGDCNEIAVKLVDQINLDPDKIMKAELIDGPGGTVVTDPVAWAADPENVGQCLGVRITSVPLQVRKFCSVNLDYFNPRGTVLIVSKVEGFECNGTLTTTQDLEFEEGLGYDIAQLEYEAGGWNGKPGPYRTSTLAGMPINSFESYVDQSAKYVQINMDYDQFSVGGWLEYLNNLNTLVAIPAADTTTLTELSNFLAAFAPGKLVNTNQ